MDEREARRPLADDPSFLERLSDLDRGLTDDPTGGPPTTAPVRPPRLRASAHQHAALPTSITAPFEALTVPGHASADLGQLAQAEAPADSERRPLLELFPPPRSGRLIDPVVPPSSTDPIETITASEPDPRTEASPATSAPLDDRDVATTIVPPSAGERFYGLVEKPFALSTDPRFFYHSTPHDAVSQQLLTAIRNRDGTVLVTGDLGAGKTTLCRVVVEQLDHRTLTSFVADAPDSGEELLRNVLADFGVVRDERRGGAATTGKDLIATLRSFVESLASLEARAVVIVDEAQNLPPEVFAQVRTLCEVAEASSHLQVLLVGQPTLAAVLRRPENRALHQRIAVRAVLDALPADEMGAYIAHRLAIAGGARVQFDEAALARIAVLSHGVPRVVNLLCDRALARGAALSAGVIDPAVIDAAAEDLDLGEPPSRLRRVGVGVAVAMWLALCAIVGGGLAAWWFRDAVARAMTRN